jgi:methyl-accepting chemotaxis protein
MLDADRLRKNLEVIINKEATLIPPKTLGSLDDEQDTSIEDFSDVPTIPQITLGKTAMTEIGQQLTTTSRNASDAAEEAERTEIIVSGLDDAKDKIEDIEKLMIGISDQMSLLAVQTALTDTENKEAENLVHLDEKRDRTKFSSKIGSGQSVNDRIETIQGGTKRAIKAAQIISVTINEVNEVAKEFSTAASREALTAANELLRQSHELRAMLDNLLDRVDTENSAFSQSKTKD